MKIFEFDKTSGFRENNKTLFLLFLLLLFPFAASANAQNDLPEAAPVNDNFANAVLLSGASGNVSVTNVDATKETSEPMHAHNLGGKSVWYKYVASGNGVLKLYTDTGFDTTIAVYRGTSFNNLVEVASNDDFLAEGTFSVRSSVTLGTQTGVTYYIAVDGQDGSSGMSTLTYEFGNVAFNDNFAANSSNGLQSASFSKTITTTNVGASKQVGEPNIAGNQGGKSVWYSFYQLSGQPRSIDFTLEAKSTTNPAANVAPLFAIYTGSSVDSLTLVTQLQGSSGVNRLTLLTQPNTRYYIAIDTYDFGNGALTANFTLTYGAHRSLKVPDFDRDGKADIGVYRPSTGIFYTRDSVTGNMRAAQWGVNGDKPMFNDFDYDGKPDYYVYRPDTQTWYINRSLTNTFSAYNWGIATDVPMTLTRFYNGNVYPYIVVFRQSTGTWWLQPPGIGSISFQFGQNGDIPMTFDYDGDGTDEIAVYRPSNGTWYLADAFTGDFKGSYQFGLNGDIPVPADYDGDGLTDIAIFRPSTGAWWFRNHLTGAQTTIKFGQAGDKPQPADYDNDGRADLTVFRNGVWWFRESLNGSVNVISFGLNNDIPVTVPIP